MNIIKKQNGGDGYVVNINQPIGGMPSYSRYSNNYKPVFDGELLQNGGQNEDPLVYDLIVQQGGEKITQFSAIKKLSELLTPLSINSLSKLNVNLFLDNLNKSNSKKSKQYGGYITELENIIAPLGKNNLIVISALLLLHYFAVNTNESEKENLMKGGNIFLNNISNILEPTGFNSNGSSVVLDLLENSFKNKTSKTKNIQKGGNPLKNLIAPLGTNAFIATGLLVAIEKMFTSKINQIKKNNSQILKGGKLSNKKFEELFNLIAPITFNTFARKSFLDNISNKK